MGVKVFSSLIEDNRQQFTELIELKNMKLVIDGIDLVRFLHNSSSQQFMNVQFAADYVSFGRIVTNFFRNLKVNNVQAYVILYGAGKAYAQSDDAKRSREPSRSHGLKLVAQLSEKFHAPPETLSNKLNQFPILSIEMFRNVLAQLNIPCIRTVLGGGPTMAKLANQLNCPVLSFNGDCYLFDLKKGFVNFSTLRFNSDTSLKKYVIRGRVYFRSTLINRFQLKPEVLPFFAVVFSDTSQDTSKPTGIVDTLTKMRARIFVSIKTKKLIKFLMVKLLNWLKHMTLEDAIRNFYDQLGDEKDKKRVERGLEWAVAHYSLVDGLDCALKHLQGVPCDSFHGVTMEDSLGRQSFMSNKMAVEFITHNWLKEVAEFKFTQEIWWPFVIDDYDRDSATMLIVPLLQQLIGMTSETRQQDDPAITLNHWRHGDKGPEICDFHVPNDTTAIVDYSSITSLDTEERSRLALAILKCSPKDLQDLKSKLCAVCKLDDVLSSELALIALILRYAEGLLPATMSPYMEYFTLSVLQCVIAYMRQRVNARLAKVRQGMSSTQRLESVYLLNIVQRIFKIFGQINLTLDCPLPAIRPEKYLNGVYIANVYAEHVQSQDSSSLNRELMAALK